MDFVDLRTTQFCNSPNTTPILYMATYVVNPTLLLPTSLYYAYSSTYSTPLTIIQQKGVLNVHNGGYISSTPYHPTTNNMNHLMWAENDAEKTEGCDGRTAIGYFKNYDMINWIIFLSIILVILLIKSGCSIEFICFLVLFYIRLPFTAAHNPKFGYNDHDMNQEVIGKGITKSIFGQHLHYKITSDGRWMFSDCEVIGKQGYGLMGDFKRYSDESHRRLNPYLGTPGSWPAGVAPNTYIVCYEINITSFVADPWDAASDALWNQAILEYSSKTGIMLIERGTGECAAATHWIRVYEGSGCWSYVGRIDNSASSYNGQDLSLGNGCQDLGVIVHELGHALGMLHTQSRSDRDDWVIIHWDNIAQDNHGSFNKSTWPIGFCYDCSSVMHYGETYFAIDNSQNTITPKDPTQCTIGFSAISPLSENDADVIELMYPTNSPTINPVDCPTVSPTINTIAPTKNPTALTNGPTITTNQPTNSPSGLTAAPITAAPTMNTAAPTSSPTMNPWCIIASSAGSSNLYGLF
eukprot:409894_1